MINLKDTPVEWLMYTNNLNIIIQYITNLLDKIKATNKSMILTVGSVFGTDWNNTPMQNLYNHYSNKPNPEKSAAYAAGILLKKVIEERNDIKQISQKKPYSYLFK